MSTCRSRTSPRRSRFYRDVLGFALMAQLGPAGRLPERGRLPPSSRRQHLGEPGGQDRHRRARRRCSTSRSCCRTRRRATRWRHARGVRASRIRRATRSCSTSLPSARSCARRARRRPRERASARSRATAGCSSSARRQLEQRVRHGHHRPGEVVAGLQLLQRSMQSSRRHVAVVVAEDPEHGDVELRAATAAGRSRRGRRRAPARASARACRSAAPAPLPASAPHVSVSPTVTVGPTSGTAQRTSGSRAAASAMIQPAWLSPSSPMRVAVDLRQRREETHLRLRVAGEHVDRRRRRALAGIPAASTGRCRACRPRARRRRASARYAANTWNSSRVCGPEPCTITRPGTGRARAAASASRRSRRRGPRAGAARPASYRVPRQVTST